MNLQDYKEIVSTCAVITTMCQMLSGTLICKDICKKGSTKGTDPMPFVGGTIMCLLMLRYAWILGEPAMININLFGLTVNVAYVLIFYIYSSNKSHIVRMIVKGFAFAAVILCYSYWEHQDQIRFRYGIIVTILLLLLIASPLLNLGKVLKTRSTEILPFPLIATGTLVSAQWLLYGYIIDDAFTVFQNAVGLLLNAIQLSLFAIFPSVPKKKNPPSKFSKRD